MNKKHINFPVTFTIFLLIIGIVTNIFIYKEWSQDPIDTKNTMATKITNKENSKDLKSIIHIAQKNVVQIEASNQTSEKIGSGFLYNNMGDIITNAHVVKNAEYITVKLANAQTYTAALVGIGEKQDIALIRVPQLANHPPALLSEDFHAEIGDEVLAVGSPLGFQNSVTLGIISGTNRSFTINDYKYENMYQISANITHGNSGGPLINRVTGKVIAINSAGTNEAGIGFSIPISNVIEKVEKWSNQIDSEELVYNSISTLNLDPEKLEKDAEYIVNYFFESLAIRDYINAYALLGSELQSKSTYQEFRADYVHVVQASINNISTEFLEDSNEMKTTLIAETKIRNSPKETLNKKWRYNFFIGYENDQLKILDSDKAELPSTTKK